jgi:hypothetical protein
MPIIARTKEAANNMVLPRESLLLPDLPLVIIGRMIAPIDASTFIVLGGEIRAIAAELDAELQAAARRE